MAKSLRGIALSEGLCHQTDWQAIVSPVLVILFSTWNSQTKQITDLAKVLRNAWGNNDEASLLGCSWTCFLRQRRATKHFAGSFLQESTCPLQPHTEKSERPFRPFQASIANRGATAAQDLARAETERLRKQLWATYRTFEFYQPSWALQMSSSGRSVMNIGLEQAASYQFWNECCAN